MQRFRGGLVFKVYRLVYHPTLGLRVIKKKKKTFSEMRPDSEEHLAQPGGAFLKDFL